jgi:hypothetical protein
MNRRTLFEPGELVRPPQVCVRPILMRPDGASMVLATFAETKVARPPGRNPATIMNIKNSSLWIVLDNLVLFAPNQSEVYGNASSKPRWTPDTHRQAVGPKPYILNDPIFPDLLSC